jgi:hypothetical protein
MFFNLEISNFPTGIAHIIGIIPTYSPCTNLILKYLKLVFDDNPHIYILNFNKLVYD